MKTGRTEDVLRPEHIIWYAQGFFDLQNMLLRFYRICNRMIKHRTHYGNVILLYGKDGRYG